MELQKKLCGGSKSYEEEFDDLLDSERRRIGWGEAAAHEATSIFFSRHGDRFLGNREVVQFCSGKRALNILSEDFSMILDTDAAKEIVGLMHVYKMGTTRAE